MSDTSTPSGWPDAQYHEAARTALTRIEAAVDRWLDDDVVDIDGARSGGMLTLTLPDRSQLIVNTQPPLHELWLAARSGGFHFRYAGDDRWHDTRTGEDFFKVLSDCASQQAGQALQF
jgi:CyaY protein